MKKAFKVLAAVWVVAVTAVAGVALAAQVSPDTYACYVNLLYNRTDSLCVDRSTFDLELFSNGTSVAEYDATNNRVGSVQAAANQACDTTCTSACVFGVNTAATEADIVDCADATADECLCAGGS